MSDKNDTSTARNTEHELIDGSQIIPPTEGAQVEQDTPATAPTSGSADSPKSADSAPSAPSADSPDSPVSPASAPSADTPDEAATQNSETYDKGKSEEKAEETLAEKKSSTSDTKETATSPKPRPIPRPRPSVAPAAPTTSSAADAEAVRLAAAWGRVDDEGTVYLRSADGERAVGQYAAGGSNDDALAFYAERYVALASQVSLLESRVENISPEEAGQSLKALEKQLKEPAVVGDVDALRTRVASLKERIAQRREEIQAARQAAKAKALEERTKLVERAEAIAAKNPAKIHWRNSREELSKIFDDWQEAQRSGPRIDRPTEEELWHRFSRARSQFDRMRRQHFTQLEAHRSEVVGTKTKLVEQAEQLKDSTDWNKGAAQFRALMDQWRKAGRASRKDDDKLWERFHSAQQAFFDARSAHFAQRDEEQEANLEAKLKLVAQAEEILPVEDLEAARNALRSIQDRWEEIGMVPRNAISRTEGRLREIEDAVRKAEADRWKATDPQKKQRSDGMAAQLEKLIADLDEEIAAAEAAGDKGKVASLKENREARQAWLDQVTQDL
ncbi:MAG: DUF349 domain-containing protein [Actinomycetaceae bacterium]|nr:DUF349 domain-containing protein [Actinomycetaceae bacterium]